MKYQVLQGKIKRSGVGDYNLMGEFNNLKEAQEFFNEIKNDKTGYGFNKNAREHLETFLLKNNDYETPVDFWSNEEEMYD